MEIEEPSWQIMLLPVAAHRTAIRCTRTFPANSLMRQSVDGSNSELNDWTSRSLHQCANLNMGRHALLLLCPQAAAATAGGVLIAIGLPGPCPSLASYQIRLLDYAKHGHSSAVTMYVTAKSSSV